MWSNIRKVLANVTNAFESLLSIGVIPIVNENDAVSVDEMDHATKFGDNDRLSAVVAKIVKADLLIMLSDIMVCLIKIRLFTPMPSCAANVADITEEIIAFCRRLGQ